jgi:exopolysaccharide production negative regulator
MRIYERLCVLACCIMLGLGSAGPASASDVNFVSPEAAQEQGVGAYRLGQYALAVPALDFAAKHGLFFGQYYLAQIYADNASAYTDHGKAYDLFRRIVEENANADPDDDQRAAYVGKALTAVAGYTRSGLPEIGLAANPERAAGFYRQAATFFRDADAQFELAKMHLKGDGVMQDRQLAFHWLATLTQEGHAGAQAFLADLLWRGKDLPKDEKRALALISVAVANASEADRIWIEDIYQNIYCGASAGTRQQAEGLVAVWSRLYASRAGTEQGERMGLGLSERTCSNGETLPAPVREGLARQGFTPDARPGAAARGAKPVVGPREGMLQGGAASGAAPGGYREIGAAQR